MPKQKSPPPSPETVAAMRTLLFGRLADIHHDLTQSLADFGTGIEKQSHNTCLGFVVYAEPRLQSMRNVLLVLREFLGG
jgi:hypothetical protein